LYLIKLGKLRKLVEKQYSQKHPDRDNWSDWLYNSHVLWVADRTNELCKQHEGNKDIAVAAALVHDIADSVMGRYCADHKERSLEIGRELCNEAGYDQGEIDVIIDDVCLKHSCRDGIVPESLEGRIMATADALFHFETDFYLYAFHHRDNHTYEQRITWIREKLEKDFLKKLFFEESKRAARPIYEALRKIT